MSFRKKGLSDDEYLKEVSMLKIIGDSKEKISKLREDFSQMHFKIDALNLVVNTLVTKDESEIKENHINNKIAEIQDVMESGRRRSEQLLEQMKDEIISSMKQKIAFEVSEIVIDLKKDFEKKEAENAYLRNEIAHMKNKQNELETAFSKMKKPDLIPCDLCVKKCNSENSLKRHKIAKHVNAKLKD